MQPPDDDGGGDGDSWARLLPDPLKVLASRECPAACGETEAGDRTAMHADGIGPRQLNDATASYPVVGPATEEAPVCGMAE